MTQGPFVNLAFYKFVRLPDPDATALEFRALTESLGMKGSIILASEGINASVAATRAAADTFIAHCRARPAFADIPFKESLSEKQPFRRMLVKLKPEIVTMGRENIEPAHFTGKYVKPLELKRWLDEGESLVLLDTRNDYEVRLGTFRNAIDPGIRTFRTFPDWVQRNLSNKKDAKIVTFCTGGIRCEKATAFMRQEGFEDVYQLEGGILKYFEETMHAGSETHYQGDCFVFDARVAVDHALRKTPHEICFACWMPLTPEERTSPLYVYEKSCPHCASEQLHKDAKRRALQLENNQRALLRRQERSRKVRESLESAQAGRAELVRNGSDGHV